MKYAIGGSEWLGTSGAMMVAWAATLPPVKKLVLIAYADGPKEPEAVAEWASLELGEVDRITAELCEAKYIAEYDEEATAAVGAMPPTGKRKIVFERDEYACRHCGAGEDLTLDHIYPQALGGGHELDNLQTLCRRCNSRKGVRI